MLKMMGSFYKVIDLLEGSIVEQDVQILSFIVAKGGHWRKVADLIQMRFYT